LTVIGFDTALATTSVCVVRDDGQVFATQPPDASRLMGPPGHSRELLPELDRLVRESGIDWSDIDSVAVGVGPGTFTGLRIGVATARALGQALRVGIRPVSSLEALALGAATKSSRGHGRPLISVIDARRGQVFVAVYVSDSAGTLAPLREPAVMEPDAVLELVGTQEPTPLAVGDWAIRSDRELEDAGAEIPPPDSGLHAVDALCICRLGGGVESVAPEEVKPVYLRLPDVELKKTSDDDVQSR
jgi:tRNA threonylcarbamoyladenosine biosynthesis protein TsaB